MKKVEKTTRPFRYDLNQIPYDYRVEVRNRFKGLDLIECLRNYGQRFGSRPSPRKRKTNWLTEEPLQIAEKRIERQRRKEKIHPFECRVPKNSKA